MPRFNQARVKELMRTGAPAKVAVGDACLYLAIRGPGKAYWVSHHRRPGGGFKDKGHGSAADITLPAARKAAKEFKADLDRGLLPAGNVRTPRGDPNGARW